MNINTEEVPALQLPSSQGAIPRIITTQRVTRSAAKAQNPLDWTLSGTNFN